MDSVHRQKDTILEGEPPRSEGVQYATGEEQRAVTNSFSKNEAAGPKWERHLAGDVSGGKSKFQCCREQYCIRT